MSDILRQRPPRRRRSTNPNLRHQALNRMYFDSPPRTSGSTPCTEVSPCLCTSPRSPSTPSAGWPLKLRRLPRPHRETDEGAHPRSQRPNATATLSSKAVSYQSSTTSLGSRESIDPDSFTRTSTRQFLAVKGLSAVLFSPGTSLHARLRSVVGLLDPCRPSSNTNLANHPK